MHALFTGRVIAAASIICISILYSMQERGDIIFYEDLVDISAYALCIVWGSLTSRGPTRSFSRSVQAERLDHV